MAHLASFIAGCVCGAAALAGWMTYQIHKHL